MSTTSAPTATGETEPLYCIFHGNCMDGVASAWAVKQAFPDTMFWAGKYNEPPPDVTDKHIVLVDFSYTRPVLLEMAKEARSILVLDHHKSAKADLVDLPPNVEVKFDMNRSGAVIAWEEFHSAPVPQLLRHVEDRDLWRFALPHTDEIVRTLFSYPLDFALFDRFVGADLAPLIAEGEVLKRQQDTTINTLISTQLHKIKIAGHDVLAVNAPPMFASEIAGRLSVAPEEPFAACYWIEWDHLTFSLRSGEHGMDVSKIAWRYGGGGHKHSAGFQIRASFEFMNDALEEEARGNNTDAAD